MTKNTPTPASRGPHDHSVRDQILDAAMAHFSRYGYEKTTVTDLAKAIGFSKAYIYKFFDSKQAIGEAICASRLEKIMVAVSEAIADAPSASEKLRRLFRALTEAAVNCFSRIANCTTSPPSRRAINGLQRNSMPVICSS